MKKRGFILLGLVLSMIFLFASLTSAATWKANPANCPKSFNSQTCPTGEKLCGSSGGTTFCYDTSSLSAPGSSTTGQDTNQGSLAGGYIVNCEAYDGSVPYCDNGGSFWCNANSTCETQNRQTTCSANTFAYQSGSSTCASCKSTHLDCDNDGGVCEIDKGANGCGNNVAGGEYDTSCNTTVNDGQCVARTNFYDCDNDVSYDNNNNQWTGNFEIEAGESCTTDSGLSGTCQVSGSNACGTSGTDSDGNDCNCVPGKSKFETGTEAQYSTSDSENAILSFKNLGQGGLINATNSLGESWRINNKSCMVLKDGTEVCTGSDLGSGGGNGSKWNLSGDYFYNNSGNLTFNTTLASSNLSVNSSSYWNGVNSFNGTQFNDESDSLNLNLTWLTGNFLETSDESNLDVNSSDYWDGFNDPDDIQYSNLSTNFWNEDVNVGSNNFTIKGDLNATGNVTSQTDFCIEGGKCLSNTGTGSGDIEGVLTDLSPYLLNGSKSGSVDLNFNESYLNNTIDARDDTTQDTNLSGDSAGGDLSGTYPSPNVENNSITLKEQNITNENWLEDSQESNLDVNSSDKWRTAEGIIDNVSGIKGSDITNDLNWINTSDIWNRSSGNVYLSSSSDNVGIGTSSPIATLDVDGNATFGGTWENGGAEITGGDVYAQTGYFYNITSLNVTSLNINGSQIPSKDDTFVLGNSTYRWKSINVGTGGLNSSGTIRQNGNSVLDTATSWSGDLSGSGKSPSVVWGNGDNKLTLKEQNITNENWLEDGQNNVTFLNHSNKGNINVTSGYDVCIEGGKCLSNTSTGSGDIEGVLTDLSPYLLNGSNSGTVDLNFNETYLNKTIDSRDDFEANTEKSGSGTYLYNNTDSILLNGTELNDTIDSRDDLGGFDGVNGAYLFNNSGNIDFNGTLLNSTIDVRINNSAFTSITGNYLVNSSGVLDFNETYLNSTIDSRSNGSTNFWNLSSGDLYPENSSYNVSLGTNKTYGNRLQVNGSINASGNITAENFVDSDGNVISGSSGGAVPSAVNLTSGKYTGNITNGSLRGYAAANQICNQEYSGSHLCNEFEISRAYESGNVGLNGKYAWIIAGGSKYPSGNPVNDCDGFTSESSGSSAPQGNYWYFNSSTGGNGAATSCASPERHLACCSY